MKRILPFGIDPLAGPEGVAKGICQASLVQVPKSHPDLKEYSIAWVGDRELHMVVGKSDVFEEDHSCSDAQDVYFRLRKQLSSLYGEPYKEEVERYDDGFWSDLILGSDQRITIWDGNAGDQPGGLSLIILAIDALPEVRAQVRLHYQFRGGRDLQDEIAASVASLG